MGPAWFGKIYNKLETILVEVDTFTSQSTLCLNSSDPSGWESVRGEPEEEYTEDYPSSDQLGLPGCLSPSDPPSHQNFDVSGNVGVEEQVEEDIVKEDLSVSSSSDGETLSGAAMIHEYCDGNLTSATTHGHEESQITLAPHKFSAEEGNVVDCNDGTAATLGISIDESNLTSDAPVEDYVANMRSSNEDKPDDVIKSKSDAAPLDIKAITGMTFREDPSCVDDNELYALHVRTKKLRSLQRKILDALTTKRIREKEYEQLAIWFGDADMGSDLAREAIDSQTSQVLESEDSQWELL